MGIRNATLTLALAALAFIGIGQVNDPAVSDKAISRKHSPSHVQHWWGERTPEPILPLVEPFSGEKNVHTGKPIYYDPEIGYSFPLNGQGHRFENIFYNETVLHYALEPDEVFTADMARECLFRRNLTWIHIDGDSLARDVYYDFTELYGMGWNHKQKTLDDLSFQGIPPQNFNASDSDHADAGAGFAPRFSFSADTINLRQAPKWYDAAKKKGACPDVWIYSSGLWDHIGHTSVERYRERTQLLADFVNDTLNNQSGKENTTDDPDCEVPHRILRHTTPYQIKDRENLDQMAVKYNYIATELLVPVGFRYVDTFEILRPRSDLSHDGIHYTGPGSKWVTNAILNLVCE